MKFQFYRSYKFFLSMALFLLSLARTAHASAPTVTTGSANPVGTATATLNGTVNPNGSQVVVYFEYGPTTNYGSLSSAVNENGSSSVPVGIPISSLSQNSPYHFRIDAYVAGNNSVVYHGSDSSFTTSSTAPTVTTGSANPVGTTTATLKGTVNPNGSQVVVYFEYGPTTNYGSLSSAVNENGSSSVPVGIPISSLNQNSPYHFRIDAYVAGNNSVVYHGSDSSFTTSSTAPTVTTGSANPVGTTTATLNGTVNPNGSQVVVYFEYGPTTNYGDMTSGVNENGSSSVPVGIPISSLSQNTPYHFRIDALNSTSKVLTTVW